MIVYHSAEYPYLLICMSLFSNLLVTTSSSFRRMSILSVAISFIPLTPTSFRRYIRVQPQPPCFRLLWSFALALFPSLYFHLPIFPHSFIPPPQLPPALLVSNSSFQYPSLLQSHSPYSHPLSPSLPHYIRIFLPLFLSVCLSPSLFVPLWVSLSISSPLSHSYVAQFTFQSIPLFPSFRLSLPLSIVLPRYICSYTLLPVSHTQLHLCAVSVCPTTQSIYLNL